MIYSERGIARYLDGDSHEESRPGRGMFWRILSRAEDKNGATWSVRRSHHFLAVAPSFHYGQKIQNKKKTCTHPHLTHLYHTHPPTPYTLQQSHQPPGPSFPAPTNRTLRTKHARSENAPRARRHVTRGLKQAGDSVLRK